MPTTRNYAQNQMKLIYYTCVFCLFIDGMALPGIVQLYLVTVTTINNSYDLSESP